MNQKNISNTYALKGGTMAWKNAGYPMEGTASVPNPPGAAQQNAAPQPPSIPSNGPPPNY